MENKTGVYYQALPAVGPDGKNVMKLIPVQKVNGKFVHTHGLTARNDFQPQVYSQPALISPASLTQNYLPTLQATADGRLTLKTPPESNILLNSVRVQHQGTNDLFRNAPNQVHAPLLASRLAPHALQLPPQCNNSAVPVINTPQQPVTLNSPIFPSGHYLQIPPNATVRTLPASALPQSIKNQICNSSNAQSNPAKGLPTVVYVSPVNSLKLGPNQPLPGGLTKVSELPQSLALTPSTSAVNSLNASSTSNPSSDQGVSGPMKWIIQEGPGNTAPCLIPVSSPSMSTDILKAVKQMETLRKANQVPPGEPVSTPATQEKISPGNDNAVVMCNGKVYFVAKKNSEISKDVISGVGSKVQDKRSVSGSCPSNSVPKPDSKTTPASKKPNEIIDLCDDDEESPVCSMSSRLTVLGEGADENDEDSNVIFVSYIPPKSETETSKKGAETAQQNDCETEADSAECEAGNVVKGCARSGTNSPVIDFEVSRCQDNVSACEDVNGGGAVSEQLEEVCDQGTDVTEKISVDSVTTQCRQESAAVTEMASQKTTWRVIHQQKSDAELRQIFGINSDLKICLPRINKAEESSPQSETRINKCTLEGIRKLMEKSQIEFKIKQLIQAQIPVSKEEGGPEDAKRKRLELEQDGQKTCSGSSSSVPPLMETVNLGDEMHIESMDACADGKDGCQGTEEETPSTSGSSEVVKQTVEPLGSSSSLQPRQTETTKSHTDCTAGSRKTPPRQSKGSGRVCTACPCGTKVGAMSVHSSPPQEKTSTCAAVEPSKQACAVTRSNKACNAGGTVLKNSSSSPPVRNEERRKSRDEKAHTSQAYKTSDEGSSLSTSSVETGNESASQSGLSSEGNMSSSSCPSQDNTPAKRKREKGTSARVEASKHHPNNTKRAKTSSSVGEILMPNEVYSSVILDPAEIKRQERIQHLKNLLKEKEAALEKLRKSM